MEQLNDRFSARRGKPHPARNKELTCIPLLSLYASKSSRTFTVHLQTFSLDVDSEMVVSGTESSRLICLSGLARSFTV
jgi:hypothetical protein